jgi:hypothetical protein
LAEGSFVPRPPRQTNGPTSILGAQDRQCAEQSAEPASKAKWTPQEIWMAETKEDALAAFDVFVETWGAKYDQAVECHVSSSIAMRYWPFTSSRPSTGNTRGRRMGSTSGFFRS